ncbi:hypothetical protein BJ508DRAFT_333539 [Ascobolus immersus RN42]|uniref:F-box domain-containing protein n=1 Tax=Ascobolus immersus RN42 TaxID=1160509 RepID=A0A3N4HJ65_ASCIM|nr:hypothetical protein BJ508DRAFT_333539 [Ascobolus immersus RN42]
MAKANDDSSSKRIPSARDFLHLPTEIRLEIYSHCTILSLLILTHTCFTMYTEINSRSIVKRAPNYDCFIQCKLPPASPMLPTGTYPLNIVMMSYTAILDSAPAMDGGPHEWELFNKVYGRQCRDRDCKKLSFNLSALNNFKPIKQQPNPEPKLDRFPFLDLPLELRLEVYDHCTILELFILTHTCKTLYTDINSRRGLLRASPGYTEFIRKCDKAVEILGHPIQHPMLPAGAAPLTIPRMTYDDRLGDTGICPCCGIRDDEFEVDGVTRNYTIEALVGDIATFNKLFGGLWEEENGYWCCERCGTIQRVKDYPLFDPAWTETSGRRLYDLSMCAECEAKLRLLVYLYLHHQINMEVELAEEEHDENEQEVDEHDENEQEEDEHDGIEQEEDEHDENGQEEDEYEENEQEEDEHDENEQEEDVGSELEEGV